MIELLIATKNPGKLREIRELLEDLPLKITSLSDYPDAPEIIEDGRTFAQNALKKAATIALYTGKLTMGEDSGIQVKALHNRPGIYSARYSDPGATDEKNNRKMLKELKGVPTEKRQARYQCWVALVDKKGILDVINGSCGGLIATEPRGRNGFGYDPLFIIPRFERTFGELPVDVKSRISHRARALKKLKKTLKTYLKQRKA